MNYELAKKLKDAGFPEVTNHPNLCGNGFKTQDVYHPSLSELIEACGDSFGICEKAKGMNQWKAQSAGTFVKVIANTAEEAVANLWLELNKKSNG